MALLGRLGEIAPSHSVSMKCVLCTSTRQEPRTAMPLLKLCVSHLQHSVIFLAKKKKKKKSFPFYPAGGIGHVYVFSSCCRFSFVDRRLHLEFSWRGGGLSCPITVAKAVNRPLRCVMCFLNI